MQEKLMTVTDVAERLGYSVGHIYNLVKDRAIPFKKLSRKALRFEADEIERWIAERDSQNQKQPQSVA